MDDIVIKGLAKWPNVPAVYGWLALDRRGAWLLKGERIENPALVGFIGRNYAHDERGRWFFQNGPQRVYVDLAYTPLVYRAREAANGQLELEAQNGKRTRSGVGAWIDEEGAMLIETELGVGLVHDRDLDTISGSLVDAVGNTLNEEALESRLNMLNEYRDSGLHLRGLQRVLPVHAIRSCDVARTFGFDARPREEVRVTPPSGA